MRQIALRNAGLAVKQMLRVEKSQNNPPTGGRHRVGALVHLVSYRLSFPSSAISLARRPFNGHVRARERSSSPAPAKVAQLATHSQDSAVSLSKKEQGAVLGKIAIGIGIGRITTNNAREFAFLHARHHILFRFRVKKRASVADSLLFPRHSFAQSLRRTRPFASFVLAFVHLSGSTMVSGEDETWNGVQYCIIYPQFLILQCGAMFLSFQSKTSLGDAEIESKFIVCTLIPSTYRDRVVCVCR